MRSLWLILVCLLPVASAQVGTYELAVGTPTVSPEEILPVTQSAAWTIPYEVRCVPPLAADLAESGAITITPTAQQGITFAGSMTATVPLPDCVQSQSTPGTLELQVQADETVPGEVALPMDADVTLAIEGRDPDTVTVQSFLRVAFAGAISAETTAGPVVVGDETRFAVNVTNQGNALAIVQVLPLGGSAAGLQIIAPTDQVLEAGMTASMEVILQGSDMAPGDAELQLQVNARSVKDAGREMEPVTLTVPITKPAPQDSPAWPALVPLGIALALARRWTP